MTDPAATSPMKFPCWSIACLMAHAIKKNETGIDVMDMSSMVNLNMRDCTFSGRPFQ